MLQGVIGARKAAENAMNCTCVLFLAVLAAFTFFSVFRFFVFAREYYLAFAPG